MTIGLQELQVALRGYGGPKRTRDKFFRQICLSDKLDVQFRPSNSAWQAAVVDLFSVSMGDVKDAEEPYEIFAERVQSGFDHAASVLAQCNLDGLDQWRADGREADVFIGGWLANEQLDLKLPARFLAECARLRLSISICTND